AVGADDGLLPDLREVPHRRAVTELCSGVDVGGVHDTCGHTRCPCCWGRVLSAHGSRPLTPLPRQGAPRTVRSGGGARPGRRHRAASWSPVVGPAAGARRRRVILPGEQRLACRAPSRAWASAAAGGQQHANGSRRAVHDSRSGGPSYSSESNRPASFWEQHEPLFSIVPACYRVREYLPDFLRSLDEQDVDKQLCEVVVVVDGCPEGSGDVVREWMARTDYPVLLVEKDNGGVASARNVGFGLAR